MQKPHKKTEQLSVEHLPSLYARNSSKINPILTKRADSHNPTVIIMCKTNFKQFETPKKTSVGRKERSKVRRGVKAAWAWRHAPRFSPVRCEPSLLTSSWVMTSGYYCCEDNTVQHLGLDIEDHRLLYE